MRCISASQKRILSADLDSSSRDDLIDKFTDKANAMAAAAPKHVADTAPVSELAHLF